MTRLHTSAYRLRAWLAASGLLAMVVGVGIAWAELQPARNDAYVAKAVSALLPSEHLSKHALNDEIADRALKTYLKTLDPMKVYFNQADVDAFKQRVHDLDDQVLKGDIAFAYEIFNTFLKRVDERLLMIEQVLAMEHDFTVDEEMISDADAAATPRTGPKPSISGGSASSTTCCCRRSTRIRTRPKARQPATSSSGGTRISPGG